MKRPADIADDPLFRKLAWKGVGLMLLSVVTVMLLGYFLFEPVTTAAVQAVEFLGPIGLFIGVFASDALGFPVPPSTYLFAAVAAESPIAIVLAITIIASITGATVAYHVGPLLTRAPIVGRILERHRPRGEALFERWGIWAVGIAALTPLPFALFCWLAGIYKMPFKRFFSATLVRAPRIIAYYGFFALGWAGAAALG